MPLDLISQAVNFALSNKWQEAIKTNLIILKENPNDVEALNRLARAYKETGNLKLAQKTYRQVLTFDHFNPIAQKNLKLMENLPKSAFKPPKNDGECPENGISFIPYRGSPQIFLEEPGKTKVVNLVNLAPASILLLLSCGDQTNLLVKRRTVTVVDEKGNYLGALPDDLSIKLLKRISAGNRYEVFVKTVSKNCLSVFIREIYRASRFRNQPTFPGAGGEYYGLGKSEVSSFEEETLGEEEVSPEEETAEGSS